MAWALRSTPTSGRLIENRRQLDRLLHVTTAGICLDTGHLLLGGIDPLELARTIPERITHVHLKDVDLALAAAVRERRIG